MCKLTKCECGKLMGGHFSEQSRTENLCKTCQSKIDVKNKIGKTEDKKKVEANLEVMGVYYEQFN